MLHVDFRAVSQLLREAHAGFCPGAELESFAVVNNKLVDVRVVSCAKVAGYPVLVTKVRLECNLVVMQVVVRFNKELELLAGRPDGGNVNLVDLAALFQGFEKDDAHGAELELGLFGVSKDRQCCKTLEMFGGVCRDRIRD